MKRNHVPLNVPLFYVRFFMEMMPFQMWRLIIILLLCCTLLKELLVCCIYFKRTHVVICTVKKNCCCAVNFEISAVLLCTVIKTGFVFCTVWKTSVISIVLVLRIIKIGKYQISFYLSFFKNWTFNSMLLCSCEGNHRYIYIA